MLKAFRAKRARLQRITSITLPVVLIGGWFWPPLGLFLLVCMVGAISISLKKGRAWCDWMCPRGSFYDIYVKPFSRNVKVPSYFKATWLRVLVLVGLMSALGVQTWYVWGDYMAVGTVFVGVLSVTTIIGIILGLMFQERAWCQICPMGTIGSWISEGTNPLMVAESCTDCKLCTKVCPMQLSPHEDKEVGAMTDGDCLKCSSCVTACPTKALNFERDTELPKAA